MRPYFSSARGACNFEKNFRTRDHYFLYVQKINNIMKFKPSANAKTESHICLNKTDGEEISREDRRDRTAEKTK